jgi:hypothetical protein
MVRLSSLSLTYTTPITCLSRPFRSPISCCLQFCCIHHSLTCCVKLCVSHSVDSASNATDERVSTPIGPPVLRPLRRACLAQHDDELRMPVLINDYPQTYWCPHFHRKPYCTLCTAHRRHATPHCSAPPSNQPAALAPHPPTPICNPN